MFKLDKVSFAFVALLSFFVGIIISFLVLDNPLNVWVYLFVVLLSITIFLVSFFQRDKPKEFSLLLSLVILSLFFGMWRAQSVQTPPKLPYPYDTRIEFEGTLIEEAVEKKGRVHHTIALSEDVSALVIGGRFPKCEFSQKVRVYGRLEKPKSFVTDVGRDFNYPTFLKKSGIYYLVKIDAKDEKIECLDTAINKSEVSTATLTLKPLIKIKKLFTNKVSENINEPEASLTNGIIIGGRGAIPETLQEAMRRSGVIHIAVLSGYNISIIAVTFQKLFMFLSLGLANIFSIIFVALFVLMAGATPPLVRAAIMAAIAMFAQSTGRTYLSGRALFFAAAVMVFFNPFILLYDASFHLSFLASSGIIYLAPIFRERINKSDSSKFSKSIKEIVILTLATQIFVTPYLLYTFGMVSVVSIPANLLVLPAVPLLMLSGFISGIFPLLLALPFFYITYAIANYIISVSEFFASLPIAVLEINIGLLIMFAFYFAFILTIYLSSRKGIKDENKKHYFL
ncbi:MAG: ComEC/Rec2 family competence protein [Candidatus Campbellbacteria bacterium]|nr:ComEC/Rec2 family competence protein [Candidatus Campbellbacteria bacterium]